MGVGKRLTKWMTGTWRTTRLATMWFGRKAAAIFLWNGWAFLGSPRFANLLQVAAIVLAAITFKVFFIPEQTLKRLEEKKALLEEKVSTLEGTITGKDSEIATKTALLEKMNGAVVTATRLAEEAEAKREVAEVAMKLALEKADTATRQAANARVELAHSKIVLGKAADDIHATREAKTQVERGLREAQAKVVTFRQEMRQRMWPSFPAYFAVRCRGPDISNYTECLASALVADPYFTYTFSKRELATALTGLRPYGKLIEAEQTRRIEEVKLKKKQILADCELQVGDDEKRRCHSLATGRSVSFETRTLDGFPDRVWLANLLDPWLKSLGSMSVCKTIDIGNPLPDDWPEDCL